MDNKTEYFTLKEDGVIGWIENMPAYSDYAPRRDRHEQAIKSAIASAVEVSNQREVEDQIRNTHRIYPPGLLQPPPTTYPLLCSVEPYGIDLALVTFSEPSSGVEETQEELAAMIHKVHEDIEGRYALTSDDLHIIHRLLCKLQTPLLSQEDADKFVDDLKDMERSFNDELF